MPCVAMPPENNVYPSAGARAAASAPTVPPAPERFSTTTGWPRASCKPVAVMRVMTSTAPPGGNGLMKRTGREGKACASAQVLTARRQAAIRVRINPPPPASVDLNQSSRTFPSRATRRAPMGVGASLPSGGRQLQQRLEVAPEDHFLLLRRETLQALHPRHRRRVPGHEGPVAAEHHALDADAVDREAQRFFAA